MINLTILSVGPSPEHTVSHMSRAEMVKHLDPAKYAVRVLEIPRQGGVEWMRDLLEHPPDAVLSGLHGGLGENGAVQGFLECAGIPYVGSKVLGSALCMDKRMCKLVLRAHNIPVPADVFIPRGEFLARGFSQYGQEIAGLGYPLVAKPNLGGSSLGVVVAAGPEALQQAAQTVCGQYRDDLLLEQFIPGREITIGLLEGPQGVTALPILDIQSPGRFFDYQAKYTDAGAGIAFSALPEYQQVMLREMAKKAFGALCCGGYARLDVIVREEQVYVLEMNTLPGLTAHSLIPKAAGGRNLSYGEFLDGLIAFALAGKNPEP
jgi:D-alanine-D-alanine ligase